MAKFLYRYLVFNLAFILAALGLGYITGAIPGFFPAHALIGVLSSLSSILNLTIVMFYFISTGSIVKNAAIDKLVDSEDYYRTKKFKASLFPWIMISIISFLSAPVLGAAYDTGKASLWLHHMGAWEALIVLGITARLSKKLLDENKDIIARAIEAVNADVDKRRALANDKRRDSQTTQ
ncbi:hypothetical protein MNBD_NITROSPINAE03-1717 [hydrothermal vent metagenome]|uniref:Uncharacterized protein n=1 Tax=hydrothermal vent metagenome TaxID=652676 RepID=A0A3B1BRW2_9ZZZZ